MTTPDTDTRPALTDVEQVAQLKRDLDDLRSTLMSRVSRQPTGDIEPTIRTTPKPDSLLLQGQTVSRATYAALWAWVVEQGLSPSVFGAGDGSTTFVLPDLRGRTLIGAGTGAGGTYPLGGTGGAATVSLTTAQLASHSHSVSVNNETTAHHHGSGNSGGHNGHAWQACSVGAAAAGSTAVLWSSFSSPGASFGDHNHGLSGGQDAFHTHGGSASNTGSGSPVDVRQPYVAVNWLIWT